MFEGIKKYLPLAKFAKRCWQKKCWKITLTLESSWLWWLHSEILLWSDACSSQTGLRGPREMIVRNTNQRQLFSNSDFDETEAAVAGGVYEIVRGLSPTFLEKKKLSEQV